MKVNIRLVGKDDETEIVMDLSDSEFDFVIRLARESERLSTCLCKPVMEVSLISN